VAEFSYGDEIPAEVVPRAPREEVIVPVDDDPPERIDPQDDPDFISEDGHDAYPAGSVSSVAVSMGSPTPVFVPKESTPLEEQDDDGVILRAALWAMKYLRHGRFWGGAEATIRERYGSGDGTVYVLDDGRKHCVIAREVGSSPDGCAYFLVGRISIASYEDLVDDEALADDVFTDAREICLCVVYEAVDAVSNVAVVESFDTVDAVPVDYLPPSPTIAFADSSDSFR
jgi:hypothetical protein